MKPFIALTLGAFKRDFRDINTLVFSLMIPLALIFLFGALFSNNQAQKYELGVVNEAQTEQGKAFVKTLDETKAFKIKELSKDDLNQQIEKGDLGMGIIIPKDFTGKEGSQLQFVSGVGRKQEAVIGSQIIAQVVDKGYNYAGIPPKIAIQEKEINTNNQGFLDFFIPGLIANSIMQLGIFGVAFAFVSQKATGVLKRLLATPIRAYHVILSEGLESTVLTMIQISILLGIGVFAYNVKVVGNLGIFFLIALMGIIVFLGFGYAIAGYAKNEKQVTALTNLIAFPMLMLSGLFFSRDIFPSWLKSITDYFPTTFLVDGLRKVMNTGAGIGDLGIQFLGLAVWMVISLFLAYKMFRWE